LHLDAVEVGVLPRVVVGVADLVVHAATPRDGMEKIPLSVLRPGPDNVGQDSLRKDDSRNHVRIFIHG
ncbi:MAG: hypothetical protein AAF989_11550, partial [Planctomycetota bacterium]